MLPLCKLISSHIQMQLRATNWAKVKCCRLPAQLVSLTHGNVCIVCQHIRISLLNPSPTFLSLFFVYEGRDHMWGNPAWQTCCAWFAKYLIYNIVSCEISDLFLTIFRFSKYPRCQSKREFTQHTPAKCCKKQVFFLEHKTYSWWACVVQLEFQCIMWKEMRREGHFFF